MISSKQYADIRLEITIRALVGELRNLEKDFNTLDLVRFVDIWAPETIAKELVLKLTKVEGAPTKKRGKKKKEVDSESSENLEGSSDGAEEGDRAGNSQTEEASLGD